MDINNLREDERRFIEHLNQKSTNQIIAAMRCTWNLRVGEYFQKFGRYVLNQREEGFGDKIYSDLSKQFSL